MNKNKETCYLFVYGTLKRGYGNGLFLADSKFIGEAETINKYTLFVSGLPYLYEEGDTCNIKGELYEIDYYKLKRIDSLEGHPNFYYRKIIDVKCLEDGKRYECFAYFINADRINFIDYKKDIEYSGKY